MKKTLLLTLLLILGMSIPIHAQSKKDYIVRAAINAGWTIKTGKTPNAYPLYYKDYLYNVKQGFAADANVQFNINNLFVIGLHYDFFRKSHSMPLFQTTEDGNTLSWSINNTYTHDFIAFSLGIQKIDGKSRYIIQYMIGLMNYKEDGNYSPYNKWLTNYSVGHCLGHGMMAGYDYMLNEHTAIGIEVTYCIGNITKLNQQGHLDNLNELVSETIYLNDPISLSRISPKAGLRYYF